MKSYHRTNKENLVQETNLWDAFVAHLDSVYFPGAAESLDTKTIAFEYNDYKKCYAK